VRERLGGEELDELAASLEHSSRGLSREQSMRVLMECAHLQIELATAYSEIGRLQKRISRWRG
jgi:hypothetical protein